MGAHFVAKYNKKSSNFVCQQGITVFDPTIIIQLD